MATYKVCGIGEHRKFFDDRAYHDAIHYILNPSKAAAIGGAGVTSPHTAAEEMRQNAVAFEKDKGKRARLSILSFEEAECVTPEQAFEYGEQIIQHYASEFQIVYAVHTNTKNIHIHFVMSQVSYIDGHRYRGKKKDYYSFQRHMKAVTHLPVYLTKDVQ